VRFRKRRDKEVWRVEPPATVRLLSTPEEIEEARQRADMHDAALHEQMRRVSERRLKANGDSA